MARADDERRETTEAATVSADGGARPAVGGQVGSRNAEPPAALVLRCVRGLGGVGAARLIERHGSAAAALASLATADRLAAVARARVVEARCVAGGISLVLAGSERYPASLGALEDPPLVLFAIGDLALLDAPAIAIVGTRAATNYGIQAAERLARGVARAGVVVVSGLARGIDAVAHAAALTSGGGTVAVLGTGVDVCYPRENLGLYRTICSRGLVVSEVIPGTRALPGAFPRRNRIVAALADVTLVIEAGVKSGALITAQHAIAMSRPVAGVPGPIDVDASAGSNQLLRDGAHVVTGVPDVLSVLDLTSRGRTRRARPEATEPAGEWTDAETRVLDALARMPTRPDELVAAAQLPVTDVVAALTSLELRGMVSVDAVGMVHRCE
ncbi:MAG: DNA-protecting protein DprA [Gemmatimonadetes bacterium]|nr:DNA-protecting protein DprA [Gemmatimonadota bacterium]